MDDREKEFWDERYRSGRTPWDYGGTPPEWKAFVCSLPAGRRILIPGCGSGYEIETALAKGHEVAGIDLSKAAVARVRRRLGGKGECVEEGDFFSHAFGEAVFDVVYERTFLCALDRELWPEYARRMAGLLAPGGVLVGYFFYGQEPDPPPYPLGEGELQYFLGFAFTRVEQRASSRPLPFFEGGETWEVWRKEGNYEL